ncbi:MAG: DUF2125 domain-containing protein, partial [Pseudomonadota bacterium]
QTAERQFRYATISVGGYPFGWQIQLTAPEVEMPDSGTRISAERALIGFSLPNFREFEWQAIGDLTIQLPIPADRQRGGVTHITATADQATGHFELGDTGARNPHFDIRQIVIRPGFDGLGKAMVQVQEDEDGSITLDVQRNTSPAPGHPLFGRLQGITIDKVTLGLIQPVWPAAQAGDPALTIDTQMLGLRPLLTEQLLNRQVPDGRLGRQIDEFGLRFTFTGPLPAGVYGFALAQWRDAGGGLDLDNLTLEVGDLALDAKGATRLDAMLQPEGQVTIELRGHDIILDELARANQMPQAFLNTAQLVIRPFIQTAEDGSEYLETELNVSNRWLALGPIRVYQLPRIAWAGAP